MKESFLIHFLITFYGVVYCDAVSSETQNPATLDDKNSYNSKHMFDGDKEVLEDSSLREVYDKFDKELLNETGPFASEFWTLNLKSVDSVGTERPTKFFENDDSTSEDPVDDTPTTTDPTDTPQTTVSEISTTDEYTTTTDDETTPEETTTLDPDKECSVSSTSYTIDSDNRLTVSWEFFAQKYNICETSHNVEVTLTMVTCADDEDCPSTSITLPVSNQTYTFPKQLEFCEAYQYRIANDWQPSNEGFKQDVDIVYPNLVMTLQETSEDRSLRVSWSYNDSPNCPKKFVTLARNQDGIQLRFESFINYQVIEDMEACDTYNITVYPDIPDVPPGSFGDFRQHTTSFAFPSEIRNLNVEYVPEDNVVSLNWNAPEVGSKCVQAYQVTATSTNDYQSRNTSYMNEIIQNVYACETYVFDISIRTSSTIELPGVSLDLLIPSRTFTAPTRPEVSRIEATRATFATSINQTAQRNFCKIQDVRFTCENTDKDVGDVRTETRKELSFEINDFHPYSEYECVAQVRNENSGLSEEPSVFSPESEKYTLRTREGKPDAPEVRILDHLASETTCAFEWSAPKNIYGELRSYDIYIKFRAFEFYNPPNCANNFDNTTEETIRDPNTRNYVFDKALPYASYLIQVKASNNEATSDYSSLRECYTLPAPPSIVRDLKILERRQHVTEAYNKTTVISWALPCRSNAIITKFIIECDILNYLHTKITFEVPVKEEEDEYSLSTDDLQPDSQYNISIKAITETGVEGEELSKTFEIEAGLPDLTNLDTAQIYIEPSTKLAKLTIPNSIFDSEVGKIRRILLLLEELGCEEVGSRVRLGFTEDHHEPRTWSEAVSEDCIPQYQTTSLTEETARQKQSGDFFVFTIGTELCETSGYCNGPLTPGKEYLLTMRFFTRKGFADSNYMKIITEKEVPLLLMLSLILSVMFVVFIVGFYITYRRTKALRQKSNDAMNDNKDVSINEFANFHRTMIANDNERMRDEYKAIQTFSDGLDKTCIASVANEKLNRYSNISPFDYNRVVLNDDELENDYINASYINGYHYPREYIAAQGPKPNTAHDFWRMVLQHRVESIVMLTSLIESNKVKCHEYFPKLNGHITFDGTRISCRSEEVHSSFIKRIMEVEKDDVKHTVKHYYFTMWPDHGVPSQAAGLIEFCKLIRSERRKPDGTMIVHCSAGVGRTGAFIALDILMQRMKQEKKINIFDLVKQLRLQRMKMVQTVDQYIFLYSSAFHLTEAKTHNHRAFQNIALYLTELNIFHRLKKGQDTNKTKESSF